MIQMRFRFQIMKVCVQGIWYTYTNSDALDPYDSSSHSLNEKFMMESQNDELEEGPLSDLSEIAVDSKERGNYN